MFWVNLQRKYWIGRNERYAQSSPYFASKNTKTNNSLKNSTAHLVVSLVRANIVSSILAVLSIGRVFADIATFFIYAR